MDRHCRIDPGGKYLAVRAALKRTQWWGRQMLIWGVHVHVGLSPAHKVMPIMSSLLDYYPQLLALLASSPWWDGQDIGCPSNRAMMFQKLPTAGLPFQFHTWTEFEKFVHDQNKAGIIDDIDESRWEIGPSSHNGYRPCRLGMSRRTSGGPPAMAWTR